MCLASLLLAAAMGFDAIVSSANAGNRDQSVARMREWVDAHPGDPQAARGLLWMARLRRDDRRIGDARLLLARAEREAGGSEWALHAAQGLADIDVEQRRYGAAIARYQVLANRPEKLWSYVGVSGLAHARGERTRFFILLGLAAAMAALFLLRMARAGLARFWPPPRELVWMAPILAILLFAATAQEPPEAHAVTALALGLAALLWESGAWSRARPSPRPLLRASLDVAQAVALLYCVVVWNGLWGKLVDTIAMGPHG